jgi:hypothetical protein
MLLLLLLLLASLHIATSHRRVIDYCRGQKGYRRGPQAQSTAPLSSMLLLLLLLLLLASLHMATPC